MNYVPVMVGLMVVLLAHDAMAAKGNDDPGALLSVSLESDVGVVLNEVPLSERGRIAAQLLAKPASFWRARAQWQVEHTSYRLIYRGFFYGPGTGGGGSRQMLPITKPEEWNIVIDPAGPRRASYQGHDVVFVAFSMTTTVLSDAASPAAAEPNLSNAGGTWDELFSLPLDPEFLYQRTRNACVDEDAYPLGTADSENAYLLFDDTCEVEAPGRQFCHLTEPLPTESCVDALTRATGRVDTALHFKRLAWNQALADAVRTGAPVGTTADVLPRLSGLQENRIIYRYVPENSCAIAEGCVGGSGWRRLLQFTASVQNQGQQPLVVGSTANGSPLRVNNNFEFSACHGHYHYAHYGLFNFGSFPGDKRAFCVESTSRWFNNENAPLVHSFSCDNQGIASGWGDDYIAGVDCQWVDITNLPKKPAGTTLPLSFQFNPDNFLCEGTPVTNASGQQVFEPTEFVTETGAPVNRPKCDFAVGTLNNNLATTPVTVSEKGGFVTSPCTRGQSTRLRDCGFQESSIRTCTPGASVTLSCKTSKKTSPPQVLRICEASAMLGGTACAYVDALATANLTGTASPVTFSCPWARDLQEMGGRYAIYSSALVDGDASASVSCN